MPIDPFGPFPGWEAIGKQFEEERRGKQFKICPLCLAEREVVESPPGMKLLACGHILRQKRKGGT